MLRKVLLIDDDRMQLRLTEAHFAQFRGEKFELDWSNSYESGLLKLLQGNYAACLLDYQLGQRDGLQLIRDAVASGCRVPIVFLTAETGESVDIQAMNAGAMDYLVKGEINTRMLERSLRYACKLGDTLEALRSLAIHDELTRLINRREFERVLADEDERARRFRRPYSLVMVDLDHFKSINDTHGHPAGDLVLRTAAERMTAQLRSVDRLARYGGEEFAILLTETDAQAACEIAGRLVLAMPQEPIVLANGTEVRVTLSAGCASVPRDADSPKALIHAADQALYRAKSAGRNRAVPASA